MGCFGGGCPHQNTPNTLFAGLRIPLRAYAIALAWIISYLYLIYFLVK